MNLRELSKLLNTIRNDPKISSSPQYANLVAHGIYVTKVMENLAQVAASSPVEDPFKAAFARKVAEFDVATYGMLVNRFAEHGIDLGMRAPAPMQMAPAPMPMAPAPMPMAPAPVAQAAPMQLRPMSSSGAGDFSIAAAAANDGKPAPGRDFLLDILKGK